MPAYKDSNTGRWYVRTRLPRWNGSLKEVTKRGFATKKEALAWEAAQKLSKENKCDMLFSDFVRDHYLPYIQKRIRRSTYLVKENIINNYVLPDFGLMKLTDITPQTVMGWQEDVLGRINPNTGQKFSRTYLHDIHTQLSCILNHAVKYYGLPSNTASYVGNMGSSNVKERPFWTLEEYKAFANVMADSPRYYYAFEVLYWTGLRVGELLALTFSDIDLTKKEIYVTKSLAHYEGADHITDPKTEDSVRTVSIPDFLCAELSEYMTQFYEPKLNERVFTMSKSQLAKQIKRGAREAGIKEITVHCLRHSHVSLLINLGFDLVSIAKRVGHKTTTMTLRYGHFFNTTANVISNKLNDLQEE